MAPRAVLFVFLLAVLYPITINLSLIDIIWRIIFEKIRCKREPNLIADNVYEERVTRNLK